MLFRHLFLICLAFAQPGFAQSDDRAPGIVDAWRAWADAGGTSASTIAILRNGTLVAESSIGVPVDTSMPLASLSKAITATCIAKLAEDGRLSMDAKIGELIDVNERVQGTTIAQLLTNSSGIWPDSTQGNPDLQNAETEMIDAIAQQSLTRDQQEGEVGAFAYNNENYAILGAIIQELTGETYEDFCTTAVLTPLKIETADFSSEWAAHGSWGGWSMSAADYARFAAASFGPDSIIGANPTQWPSVDLGSGTNFGMGVLWRAIGESHLFWFSGMLCWDGSGDGGYYARYGDEWLVVTLYSDCLDGTERLNELDRALFEASLR